MVDIFRKQLGDPTVSIVYWRPANGHWIDELGQPVTLNASPGRAVTAIDRRGEPIAVAVHDPLFLSEPHRLCAAIWAAAELIDTTSANVELQVSSSTSERREYGSSRPATDTAEGGAQPGAQQRLVGTALTLRVASGRPRAIRP